MVSIKDATHDPSHPNRDIPDGWNLNEREKGAIMSALERSDQASNLAHNHSKEMLQFSRIYFERAVEGHRKAVGDLSIENIEAVYLTSIMVSFNALCTLSESEEDSTLPGLDPRQWLRLASGTRIICRRWEDLVGKAWQASAGGYYGKPDMTDAETLFQRANGKPFGRLRTWALDYETVSEDDQDAYQKVLSYIGLMYTGIMEGTDTPLATCRRINAMPSRCPQRFNDLIEAKQPRAMTMRKSRLLFSLSMIAPQYAKNPSVLS